MTEFIMGLVFGIALTIVGQKLWKKWDCKKDADKFRRPPRTMGRA